MRQISATILTIGECGATHRVSHGPICRRAAGIDARSKRRHLDGQWKMLRIVFGRPAWLGVRFPSIQRSVMRLLKPLACWTLIQ